MSPPRIPRVTWCPAGLVRYHCGHTKTLIKRESTSRLRIWCFGVRLPPGARKTLIKCPQVERSKTYRVEIGRLHGVCTVDYSRDGGDRGRAKWRLAEHPLPQPQRQTWCGFPRSVSSRPDVEKVR